jgi:hypothetical protein
MNPYFILGIVFVFLVTNHLVEPPWHKWMLDNVPYWLAVLNIIIFDICAIAILMHAVRKISNSQAGLLILIFFVSLFLFKVSAIKEPLFATISMIFLTFLFLYMERRDRKIKANLTRG